MLFDLNLANNDTVFQNLDHLSVQLTVIKILKIATILQLIYGFRQENSNLITVLSIKQSNSNKKEGLRLSVDADRR